MLVLTGRINFPTSTAFENRASQEASTTSSCCVGSGGSFTCSFFDARGHPRHKLGGFSGANGHPLHESTDHGTAIVHWSVVS